MFLLSLGYSRVLELVACNYFGPQREAPYAPRGAGRGVTQLFAVKGPIRYIGPALKR